MIIKRRSAVIMIIIVVGMHRSGTSALAGLLHQNGIVMGREDNFIPRPSKQNIKGFYENFLFRRLNDDMIERSGYVVKSWDTGIPEIRAGILKRHALRKLIRQSQKQYAHWGWKDPRTCLTLGIWLAEMKRMHLLDDCRILYIVRDPVSVAYSMAARKNTNIETALVLWAQYNEHALQAIGRFDVAAHYVAYRDLCTDPLETSRSISRFLDFPINDRIAARFIDPRLNRSPRALDESDAATVPKDLIERVKGLEQTLFLKTDRNTDVSV